MARLSASTDEPAFSGLALGKFLELVSAPEPAPAGGSVAALAVSLAAALCAMTARLSTKQIADAAELATAAEKLRDRAELLCQADAEAYGRVIAAMRLAREPDPEDRRLQIAAALSAASDVPLEVVQIASRVGEIALRMAEEGNPNLLGDSVTAALMADAGARSAGALVLINLNGDEEDDRCAQVAVLLEETGEHARRARGRVGA